MSTEPTESEKPFSASTTPVQTSNELPTKAKPEMQKKSSNKVPIIMVSCLVLLLLCCASFLVIFRFFGYAEANGKCLFVGQFSVEVPKDSKCYDQYVSDIDEMEEADEVKDSLDYKNELNTADYEGYTLLEEEMYSIYYPSDWFLEEGSIPVISKVELGTNKVGTFNSNINIVSQSGYDGEYTEAVCSSIADSAAAGNQSVYDSLTVMEVKLIDTRYGKDVCEIKYDASIQNIPLMFSQYVFTSEEFESTIVLTLITDEKEEDDFAELEKIAESISLKVAE